MQQHLTKYWEIERYIKYCEENDIRYEVIRCVGDYQNTHKVPKEIVENMKARMEPINYEKIYYNGELFDTYLQYLVEVSA